MLTQVKIVMLLSILHLSSNDNLSLNLKAETKAFSYGDTASLIIIIIS